MRSQLDGRIAGTGIVSTYIETEDNYCDNRVHVRLTHDPASMKEETFDKLCADMAGGVKSYFVHIKLSQGNTGLQRKE